MATVTSGSTTNRIPLHVIHSNDESFFQHPSSPGPAVYDMKNMGDETDRIKIRMREFEDRCKRWREDFFAKQNNSPTHQYIQDTNFHQASPPPPPTFSDFNNNNNFSSSKTSLPAFSTTSPPFASSLHRSSIEDTENGGKKYKIEFDIGDFKQNELQICAQSKSLVVKGDREVKAGSSTETKTFNRELTVPDYVDMDNMNAFLLDKDTNAADSSNVLILEAPIIMEKYTYRRSAFDTNKHSPIRVSKNSPAHSVNSSQVPRPQTHSNLISRSNLPAKSTTTESHHSENKTSTTSTSHTTSKTFINGVPDEHYSTLNSNGKPVHADHDFYSPKSSSHRASTTMLQNVQPTTHNQITPELISGYPIYDNKEGCVVYKFDFNGFDQTEIHLTITVDRTLEIKACKESSDHLGKVYREFKREIQLEPEVDANLIKNLLYDGILTLKIPKPNRKDGNGSISNQHNLHSPNGFQEFYTDDGKLAKLTSDFKGFNPENVKIVLSANNVLKINAHQSDSTNTAVGTTSSKGTVKKECSRQYTLPAWIQPEQMRAIMSRDGILTVDFTGKLPSASSANNKYDDRIHIS